MLREKLTFRPEEADDLLGNLPSSPAVFLLRGEGEPYVSKTANLRRRLERLLGVPKEQSKRLNLRDRVREVEYTLTGSDFESHFLIYQLLRESFPQTYAARLRLRPAPLIKLHLENGYPRASVTTRLGKIAWGQPPAAAGASDARQDASVAKPENASKTNLYFGPFQSRAGAEKFANDALDFFKMRRCVEDLHPDPAFPGCVYSEMKMCLAPCFKGCSDAEYEAEVSRVQDFFSSAGDSLARDLATQRDCASAELAFEEAAAVHVRIEKLKPVLSQCPEIVRRIDQLDALVVQPSAEAGAVALFRFRDVTFSGPLIFRIELREQSRSMESQVAEIIASFAAPVASAAHRTEHLAILRRWYYRSTRVGEVFFADDKGEWPFRRMVRGIGRVAKGEKPKEPSTFPAPADASSPS